MGKKKISGNVNNDFKMGCVRAGEPLVGWFHSSPKDRMKKEDKIVGG